MPDDLKEPAADAPATVDALAATLKEFQAIIDPAKRKAFYDAHPELREKISPVNFHV